MRCVSSLPPDWSPQPLESADHQFGVFDLMVQTSTKVTATPFGRQSGDASEDSSVTSCFASSSSSSSPPHRLPPPQALCHSSPSSSSSQAVKGTDLRNKASSKIFPARQLSFPSNCLFCTFALPATRVSALGRRHDPVSTHSFDKVSSGAITLSSTSCFGFTLHPCFHGN